MASLLEDLAEQGLQSDARYAESLIASRRGRGVGPVRIAQELREAGVTEQTFRDLLDRDGESWVALARAARIKRFGARTPGDYAESARQRRFLEYRGYTHSQIRGALGDAEPESD